MQCADELDHWISHLDFLVAAEDCRYVLSLSGWKVLGLRVHSWRSCWRKIVTEFLIGWDRFVT